MRHWIRTCQECGRIQACNPPPLDKELSNRYMNAKCKSCKSEALDYGHWVYEEGQRGGV